MEKKPQTAKQLARNKKLSEVTPFKKGNQLAVGHGRPKMSAEQKALALKTRTQFKEILSAYSALTLPEIKVHLIEKLLPAIDMAVLKHLEQMIESGSMERVDWMADHIMGAKPKQSEVIVTARKDVDLKKVSPEQLEQLKKIAASNES